jgi:prepilin-type processing-associated H-X9-DG protein
MLFPGYGVEGKSVSDGTSNTIMLGERWYQTRAWTLGDYWSTGGQGPKMPIKGHTPLDTASVACKNINQNLPPNPNFNSVGFYISHNNDIDRPVRPDGFTSPSLNFNDLPFGSFHAGGVNFARADGSVQFIDDGIDPILYGALASRNGEETISQ